MQAFTPHGYSSNNSLLLQVILKIYALVVNTECLITRHFIPSAQHVYSKYTKIL